MDDVGETRGGGFDWEDAEDLTALSRRDLAARLETLCEEERPLAYRRQILQGRIDPIRAELVGRGCVALPPGELARVLLGEAEAPPATGSSRDLP